MRMTGKFVLLLAAMLALFLGQAQAQRCLPGMKGVQLMADMVDGFYCNRISGRTLQRRTYQSDKDFFSFPANLVQPRPFTRTKLDRTVESRTAGRIQRVLC